MTDEPHEIDWSETDDKWTEGESEDEPLSTVLYDGIECADCGEKVTLYDFDPDADGPSWHGECCGYHYWARPSAVDLSYSDADL